MRVSEPRGRGSASFRYRENMSLPFWGHQPVRSVGSKIKPLHSALVSGQLPGGQLTIASRLDRLYLLFAARRLPSPIPDRATQLLDHQVPMWQMCRTRRRTGRNARQLNVWRIWRFTTRPHGSRLRPYCWLYRSQSRASRQTRDITYGSWAFGSANPATCLRTRGKRHHTNGWGKRGFPFPCTKTATKKALS